MEPYILTTDQNNALSRIDNEIDAIKEREASTQGRIKAIEKYAQSYTGDENKPKRVTFLSALVAVSEDTVDKTKTGVVNLGSAIVSRFLGEPITVEVTKAPAKEKETEINESETGIATVFNEITKVSKNIRQLTTDELQVLNALAHTAFDSVMRLFGNIKIVIQKDDGTTINKTVEIPPAAANFAATLVAASNGRTDPFMLSDKIIAERKGMSVKTIVRGRQSLLDFMELIGKEIIKMEATPQGYIYHVTLLESTTRAMYELLQSNNANPDVLTTVAAVSGKFLTGETAKMQETLSETEFQTATEMAASLQNIVNELPIPVIQQTPQKQGQLLKANQNRMAKLKKAHTKAIDDAQTLIDAGLLDTTANDEIKKTGTAIAQANKKFTDDDSGKNVPDFERLDKMLKVSQDAIQAASQTATEKAKESQATAAASGEPKTIRQVADEYFGMLPLPEQQQADVENRLELFIETTYYIAAGTSVLATDANRSEAMRHRYMELQDTIQRAFGFGAYATPTDTTPTTAEAAQG